jgi:hypothetical protein
MATTKTKKKKKKASKQDVHQKETAHELIMEKLCYQQY